MYSLPNGWTKAALWLTAAAVAACSPSEDAPPQARPQSFSGILPGTEVDRHQLPLAAEGPYGAPWMASSRDALPAADREAFELGTRLAFCADRSLRDYERAAELLEGLSAVSESAAALRVLAWARYHSGNADAGMHGYDRALQVDPEFGFAHYDLAFLLSLRDPQRGKKHFLAAESAGVDDVRDLKLRFYPE